ncbi:hypothetical protein [Streptomyces kanamyceticus]|uniref:Uncharacterized protein n=1 Tax=Streptomyces kanamyceticus TaxID=1967 RepID=A0A5J6G5B0_STRKN|nr:hypothetical protein [Streptomyces kanamyceticus]QEU90117.1 hypothetical protein CP970_03615 [Streptomyces kanamyceticus]
MSASTQPRFRPVAWRWRRNPLRRRSDVVEAWTRLSLGVVALCVAPLTGAFAGLSTYDTTHAEAQRQRAENHVVSATLAEDAPAVSGVDSRTRYPVTVRWTDRGGTAHKATARVTAGAEAGSRTDVWLDAHGRVTAAPMAEDVQWGTAIGVGGAATLVVWVFTGGVRIAVRGVAHRRRMAEWERAWARTEPRWTGSQP